MLTQDDFYERPMVKRIAEIFGHPQRPAVGPEVIFDLDERDLAEIARFPWNAINRDQYGYFLEGLNVSALKGEVFDYLFPAFLIIWWEAQRRQENEPSAGSDFYSALEYSECLYKNMDDDRRTLVEEWMADAFVDGVDAWSGQLKFVNNDVGARFVGPVWRFNALGQTTMITPLLWQRLRNVTSAGRAQFWLVLVSGIAFARGDCEFIPETHDDYGILGSYAEFTQGTHGFFLENANFMRENATVDFLVESLSVSRPLLVEELDREWATAVLGEIEQKLDRFSKRLSLYLDRLTEYELGGDFDLEDDD